MTYVKGLGHVGILAKNIENSIKFYKDVLEFKLEKRDEISISNGDIKLAILSAGTCIIELIEKPEMETENIGSLIEHLCIEVENIQEFKNKLHDKGVKFETDEVEIMPKLLGGIKNIFFKGPNGERLELVENIK